MDLDDIAPRSTPKDIATEEDLSKLSIAELEHRIVALRREIARVEAEIAAKRAHEAAASALFKR